MTTTTPQAHEAALDQSVQQLCVAVYPWSRRPSASSSRSWSSTDAATCRTSGASSAPKAPPGPGGALCLTRMPLASCRPPPPPLN